MFSRLFFILLCAGLCWCGGNNSAFGQATEVQFLSGRGKDDAVPWRFLCTSGANSGFWTNLPVPSQWDVRGFGTLHYTRDLTNAYEERGLYAHDFFVPQDWTSRRIFLVFEGVMTDTAAKLNGQSVGPVHQGSFYRFKYEVTTLVKFGVTNRLEVSVAKHSANASVNAAERQGDYWLFGGIYRPVYLEAVPPQFLERVAIDAQANGNFLMEVFGNGITDANLVEARIKTLTGQPVGDVFSGKISGGKVTLKTQIAGIKLWTAETPNLYRVEVLLKQGDRVIHRISQRFGFRTFEVRAGDGLYLNSRRIILKGANRHSFWPDSGRCLSEAVHRLDIATLKDANMNAVRMSHYPPDAQFLDLCDELGLYVLDELAGWHWHYDTRVGTKLVEEMLTRDVNHPSILFWDNGNEGGWNTNLDGLFGQFDPQQRHVLHPWDIHGDINAGHYKSYDAARALCDGNVIYMPTEFLHGLFDGGAGAGLDDYWHLMSSSRVCAGGFIWALLDEGVRRPDNGEIDVAGNRAPDGTVGPYRQREGSFYAIKEIWSPIQILETNLPEKFGTQLTLTVENHFNFTDTSECKFIWQAHHLPDPGQPPAGDYSEGSGIPPTIAPGGTGKLILNLPENFWHTVSVKKENVFSLRVEDPIGRELWTWVWPLTADNSPRLAEEPAKARAIPSETNGIITVKSGDLTTTFSQQTGLLLGGQRGAQKFSLTNGPRLAMGNAALREIHFTNDGFDVVIAAKFTGDLKSVLWRVGGNGWIQCHYTYTASGSNDLLGVLFDYPENFVRHKRWLGHGPYRVWQNRLRGSTLGVWENDYNDTITGYRGWVYPEFKGFFSDVRWLQLDTTEGQITVLNPGAVPFVQVLTPSFPPAKLPGKATVLMPKCGLGFLDVIPPIGSKFWPAKDGGPQGELSGVPGEYSGAVSFYFGQLP